MDWKALSEKFKSEDIEWRAQRAGVSSGDKPWVMVLAYVTNRAIMERLDDVCGPENWCNQYTTGPDGGVLCGISIRCNGEWITKWDGADKTNVEAVKGGLSGAMKRAGVQWGIGRYLYNLDATFGVISEKGSHQGEAKKKDGSKLYFKWNPPELPKWALPSKQACIDRSEIPEIPPPSLLAIAEVEIRKIKAIPHLQSHWEKHYKTYKADPNFALIEKIKDEVKSDIITKLKDGN